MAKAQKIVKFKTELVQATTGSGWHFLLMGKDVVDKFGFEDKFKRVICSMNGDEGFQCALLPWGELFYIIVNKKKRDAIGVVAGDMIDVELIKDESKYGLPMPEELQEVLNQDSEGDKLFHALSAGKQRSILYLIGKSKNIDLRIHHSLVVVEHLKKHNDIIGKVLHEELKRPVF